MTVLSLVVSCPLYTYQATAFDGNEDAYQTYRQPVVRIMSAAPQVSDNQSAFRIMPGALSNDRTPAAMTMLPAAPGDDEPGIKLGGYSSALIAGGTDWAAVSMYSMLGTLALASHNWDTNSKVAKKTAGFAYLESPAVYQTTEYAAQAGLATVNASDAYARGFDGTDVTVSVVDTPFDTDHPDLDSAFITGWNPYTNDTVVDRCTVNGAVAADSACEGSGSSVRQHGTHVAGIIAAEKNDTGMHGIAYKAKIKPIAFLSQVAASMPAWSNVFDNASGSSIIASNNSWGVVSDNYSQQYNGKVFKIPQPTPVSSAYETALSNAADNGTVMVFAAGNDGWNAETGLVRLYDNVTGLWDGSSTAAASTLATTFGDLTANMIDNRTAAPTYASDNSSFVIDEGNSRFRYLVVAAMTPSTDRIATYSNACGVTMAYCITAPGSSIYSTDDNGTYSSLSGTSMATPHVTGAIALLKQNWPNLDPEEIVEIILKTATDKGATGVDEIYGHGLLNLKAATGPLGGFNIAPWAAGSGSPSQLGASNIGMVTPQAMGSALSAQTVEVAALDGYERVYVLRVPVADTTNTKMNVSAMMDHALRPEVTGATVAINDTASFTLDVDDSADIRRASVKYRYQTPGQNLRLGYVDHRVSGDVATPLGGGFSDDYAAYFYAMETDQLITQSAHFNSEVTAPFGDDKIKSVGTMFRYGRTDAGDERIQSATAFGLSGEGYEIASTFGVVRETNGILGGNGTGALTLAAPSTTIFGRIDGRLQLTSNVHFSGYYSQGRTRVRFANGDLASLDGLRTDSYGVKLRRMLAPETGRELVLSAWRPTAVTHGALTINTIAGYESSGAMRRGSYHYALSPRRETAYRLEMVQRPTAASQLSLAVFHRINAGNVGGATDTGAFFVSRQQF